MGNVTCKIVEKGIIWIKMHDSMVITVINIIYVPNLKKNYISLDILNFLGANIHVGVEFFKSLEVLL